MWSWFIKGLYWLFQLFQEGPHCAIKEDEFFDAVDASLDKLEKEEEVVRHTFYLYVNFSGDKNISILHLSCRASHLQFSLVLQTYAYVL